MFLKISTVDGEATDKDHAGEIDIFSYSLGASNPSSVATGTGSGAGKVSISSLSVQKVVDLSSPKLFQYCCNGKHFDEATLTVREAGGDAPVEYMKIKMKQVFVDSVSWGGASGGGKPSESLTLSFAELVFEYSSQTKEGGVDKTVPAGWNVQTNQPAS
jgi:type VI secretion system secreted protein Hcp